MNIAPGLPGVESKQLYTSKTCITCERAPDIACGGSEELGCGAYIICRRCAFKLAQLYERTPWNYQIICVRCNPAAKSPLTLNRKGGGDGHRDGDGVGDPDVISAPSKKEAIIRVR